MKALYRRIVWCMVPVILGLGIVSLAWYNYGNPQPVHVLGKDRPEFKLGVDLVGGTILVYEIDPDKKPEGYEPDQLVAALKRRLDPTDIYNITVRAVSDTRVEIILPTGGRHRAQTLEEARDAEWQTLVKNAGETFKVDPAKLKAPTGDVRALAQAISTNNPEVTRGRIKDFIAKSYAQKDRDLTEQKVAEFKDLIGRVGSLEFRILANEGDDAASIAAAKNFMAEAKKTWDESFIKAIIDRWPDADKPGPGGVDRASNTAPGHLEGVQALVLARYPNEDPEKVKEFLEQTFDAVAKDEPNKPNALRALRRLALNGLPPPPPEDLEHRVRTFQANLDKSVKNFTYGWVEIGKNQLHELGMHNDASWDSVLDKAAEKFGIDAKEFDALPRDRDALIKHLVDHLAKGGNAEVRDEKTGEVHAFLKEVIGEHWERWGWIAAANAREKGLLYLNGDATRGSYIYSRPVLNPKRLEFRDWDKEYEYFYLTREPEPGKEVTGKYLTSASSGTDDKGKLAVTFTFNATGANLFGELTGENKDRFLSIVLDGYAQNSAVIISAIRDRGQISGTFTKAEVDRLVSVLRSGALPATLKPTPVSENTMGATLGDDTIRAGTLSIMAAFGAVLLFMIAYYRFAGFVACVALLANLILTIAFMVLVNATFTLPGLAGLVLTLAMAVDANVLIYERIREERERGASLALSIRNGYDRAFPTVIDTHLSSIFTAIVLYIVGNDQLKGFGISLTVGLIISLFTALYMTRTIFDIWQTKGWLKKLSMAKLFSKTNINFMGIRKPVFAFTIGAALFGVAIFLLRGRSALNMDFVGGTVFGGETATTAMIEEGDYKGPMLTIGTLRRLLSDEQQQVRLALDPKQDPIPEDDKGFEWTLVYADGNRRRIQLPEATTPEQLRQRAEALPEPSVELIFSSSPGVSEGNRSRRFTVRTPEKSSELVGAALNRLLVDDKGEPLMKRTSLSGYTVGEALLIFDKPRTLAEVRPVLDEALKLDKNAALVGREEGEKATFKLAVLTFIQPRQAAELNAALLALKEKGIANFQFGGARLTLSDFAYPAQVKNLLDQAFKQALNGQKVGLEPEPAAEEREGQFKVLDLKLPVTLDGPAFARAVDQFATEVSSRPLPIRLENFDSQLAADTQQRALYAIVASWAAMLLYLWFRFGNWTFGLAAVICLVHDVCFTLGLVTLAHYLHGSFVGEALALHDFKLDLAAVASLLTLIGFSVNDTIVVFDRIREVRGKNPLLTPEMVNTSINQTLSRTVLTSFIAWMVVLVLYIWGGDGVHLFAFVMVTGVLVGTFSSIYVASPLLLYLGEGAATPGTRERVAQPTEAEGRERE